MDSMTTENSDSDSCESWTLLDNTTGLESEDAPELPKCVDHHVSDIGSHSEKDEDTDGISIISDSDHEPSTPCVHLSCEELNDSTDSPQEDCPAEPDTSQCPLVEPLATNTQMLTKGSARDEDVFLGDNTGKLRTYVHRRNKRLSTVLNIIVLGSIITAAGVAIGHMWGVRDDCIIHSTPSVNKILSNLYKLQEENAYLRNKIKELTMVYSANTQRDNKHSKHPKQQRCTKVFEESLTSENVDKLTKCVEYDDTSPDRGIESHMVQPQYEKEYLSDIDKLKHVYQQNKSWLDVEIAKRQRNEKHSIHRIKAQLKSLQNDKESKQEKSDRDDKLQPAYIPLEPSKTPEVNDTLITMKISYADSLKMESKAKTRHKRESKSELHSNPFSRDQSKKKKLNKEGEFYMESSLSEDDIRKDDRYNDMKHKYDKKKDSHRKIHKKQKRRSKYEQWELKGGYMKDFDDISETSQETGFILIQKENKPRNDELNNYSNQVDAKNKGGKSETVFEVKDDDHCKLERKHGDEKSKWYERRAAQRSEARRKLERELFEREPSAAAWYFRRMQRRERVRFSPQPNLDNFTRKITKRQKNYKTKH